MEPLAGIEPPFTEKDKIYLPGQLHHSESRTHWAPLEGPRPPARAGGLSVDQRLPHHQGHQDLTKEIARLPKPGRI